MELTKMPNKLFTKKLLGTASQIDELEFQKQVEKDPRVLDDFHFTEKIWEESAKVHVFGLIDADTDWKSIRGRVDSRFIFKHKKIPFGIYFMRIAALFLLTGGLSMGFYKLLLVHKGDEKGFTSYDTEATSKNIILPDGSTVVLNRGSNITFREGFGSTSRDVILQGEAFFSVIPGLALPFKVYIGKSVVEVTGTQFTVYENTNGVQVSVLSGTVILGSRNASLPRISIKANHSGYMLENNQLKVEEGIPVNALSWKTGHLIFDQMPIDSALMDIARHFNRQLSIETKIQERVTAEFQNQPLYEILDELKLVAGLQFDTTGTALIVRK
jgi:ferric-dicitrate binding protein FerR (iron transport regulator)